MKQVIQPTTAAARAAVDRLAHQLATPAPDPGRWGAQSLADGAAGVALLHVERAHARIAGWEPAHSWLTQAARSDILATPDAGLYLGAPAVAFAVHTANTDGSSRYTQARNTLDAAVAKLTHRRVEHAHARHTAGRLAKFAEFDLISGLTGIGAHLLRHAPGNNALERILGYLVRLTRPLRMDGETLPGWWTDQTPHATTSPEFPGGHANFGLAHGITGPLALLSLSERRGIVVDGHLEAIEAICTWLDTWRQDHDTGPWWPQWITRHELRTRQVHQPRPLRPSWCYGTPGIARAQQLAGIATGDTARQRLAEHALAACLADSAQLAAITDISLCHGWAGLFQTAWRAAADATTPTIAEHLPQLVSQLLRHAEPSAAGAGLLVGDTGVALALHTAATEPTTTGWDACLLIT